MFMIYAPKKYFYKNDQPTQDFIYPIDIIINYQDLIGNKYKQKLKTSISKFVLYENTTVVNSWNTADLHYYENFEHIVKND